MGRTTDIIRGKWLSRIVLAGLGFFAAQGCSTVSGNTPSAAIAKPDTVESPFSLKVPVKPVHEGEASWYGPGFGGRKTASGDIFDEAKLTAAHKTLPLGSRAKVTNLTTGKTVEVEINDRGPFIPGRIIDLSHAAARQLGIVDRGTARVRVEILSDTQ